MDEAEFQELLRYQTMLSRSLLQEAKTDRKITVLEIVNGFPAKRTVQVAEILHEAELRGLVPDDVYDIVDELVKDGMLLKVGESSVRRV